MGISVYERRKFVRVEMNLEARMNVQFQAAINGLSLGGCLVESARHLKINDSVLLEFSSFGEDIRLSANVIHAVDEKRFGVRFEPGASEDMVRLTKLIEKIQDFSGSLRSARIDVKQEAWLDREPVTLTSLSDWGCFIETQAPFNPGDIVEIRFSLDQKEIHVAGQVRWRNAQGIGMEYLSPEPDQLNIISDFVSRKLPGSTVH